ncbi:MAG TPA: zinc ribbon domain-containing protein [Sphingomonadaceae bacterium]|nr:zinc ribbon domain-containing protein [Sphingomonadaceae bacterium]
MERRRFLLSAAQMSEGFAAARAIPANSEFLSGLPPASGILPDELAGEDGELDPAARLVFETLAQPVCSLRFLGFAEGSATGLETRLASPDGASWIAFARPAPDRWDVALIGGPAQALALADELLGASLVPDPGEELAIDLGSEEIVLLATMAQQARQEVLRARLLGREGGSECLGAPADLTSLEAIIKRERDRPDPGSPLTRLGMLCGGDLLGRIDSGTLWRGLDALAAQGLASESDALTDRGAALAEMLASRSAMSLVQSARRVGDAVMVDELILLHGPGSLLTGTWSPEGGNGAERSQAAPGLSLRTARGADLLMLLERLLAWGDARPSPAFVAQPNEPAPEPVSEAGICDACGTLFPAGSRFCRECGMGLVAVK